MNSSRITRRSALGILALLGLAPSVVLADQDEGQKLASKGYDLLEAGKPGEALAALKEAAVQDPANPWVFNLLGRAYYQAGQGGQAAENFRMAMRIDPGDGYSRMMLDLLAQYSMQAPKRTEGTGKGRPSGRTRPSQLEADARDELDAFLRSGKPPGRRLVVIDPGHGGADRGIAGGTGLAEKDVTLPLAAALARAMEGEGSGPRVLLTREADFDEPLWARQALAALFGADLFVSLHCSASLPGHGGVEIYTFSSRPSDDQARAVADVENGVTRFERSRPPARPLPGPIEFLASWRARRNAARSREIAGDLARDLAPGKPLDKVRVGSAPLKVLADAPCPALLVETGFLSNDAEEAALKNRQYLEKIAGSMASALTRSLG